jgi:signal transduction histidine kinase
VSLVCKYDLAKEATLNVNVQIIFWMDAFLYLMLHSAMWYGLARFRSHVVGLWSLSGIFSAVGLGVLGSRGWLSVDVVVVFGQLLMAAGNWGRQIALRSIDGPPPPRWMWMSSLLNLGFLGLSYSLHFSGAPESTIVLVFYAYYTFNCLEYYLSGQRIGLSHDTIGATSVKWAGLVLASTLGIKTLALLTGVGATDLYEIAWDQGVVFAGQFSAMILLCVGFMQIFIDKDHRSKISIEQQLAREQERAALALQHSEDLGILLTEREEIIRQLTLSNKSAGMGALVASFAHELNQPLTATLLHAELIGSHLKQAELDTQMLQSVSGFIVSDTQRAADIIRKLRNLFRMSKGEFQRLDFKQLVFDVLDIVAVKMQTSGIEVITKIEPHFELTGDLTQLQQVVLNLINNAVDALNLVDRQPRQLKITGEAQEGYLVLTVADNGPGISVEDQEAVFSLFKSSKSDGMGVGLWLSQSIIESHGGMLTFTTEPGRGCAFTLKLPSAEYAFTS